MKHVIGYGLFTPRDSGEHPGYEGVKKRPDVTRRGLTLVYGSFFPMSNK